MKKILPYILILFMLIGFFSPTVKLNAQASAGCTLEGVPVSFDEAKCKTQGGTWATSSTTYGLLSPLPNLTSFDSAEPNALGKYLNTMITIVIGLAAVMAVVMIVMGGIEYMTSELVHSKEAGKEKITGAILGLLIALGAYSLLYTINPDLLNVDLASVKGVTVTVDLQDLGGEASSTPFIAISNATLKTRGIDCGGGTGKSFATTVGQQFQGKSTYSQTARNTTNASTIFLDCSSFVAQVYSCANLPNPGGTTAAIFSSGNTRAVTGASFDFSQLSPGDLVGWKKGDNGSGKKVEGNGHVMIYLGDGKVLHSSSTSGGVTVSDLNSYKSRITYVKWP